MRDIALGAVVCAFMMLGSPACVSTESHPVEVEGLFHSEVKPVLEYYCIECHDSKSRGQYGGLSIETAREAMTTGRNSPVIVPGNPDASLLYKVLRFGHEDPLGMPPAPDKVSDEQLASVRAWIKKGAVWPAGERGRLRLPQ
ncbi:cytochrome c [Roseimicrobium gellanilyticum]|uniref:Cytochrome c n=1 Tax=Roseimicrobium gellanilyticum TaxID=748857 RepID=A0A366H9G7_9BACT|nr:c-type cytochrome domain-containing protein [Roseimicrobium gellanilyticum]RBP38164.1 cytochrome c [Roseimicrobium gellanilyticum]